MIQMGRKVFNKLPENIRSTAFVRLFGLTKVPLIWYVGPSVKEFSDEKCVIKVPLNRRTKNHLGSMYFGVLCTAADVAGGVVAMREIQNSGRKIALSFKDFEADFLKRAEGDTFFTNTQGLEIRAFVQRAIESGERENMPVKVTATVPSKFGDEPVAEFTLTLSIKLKS